MSFIADLVAKVEPCILVSLASFNKINRREARELAARFAGEKHGRAGIQVLPVFLDAYHHAAYLRGWFSGYEENQKDLGKIIGGRI